MTKIWKTMVHSVVLVDENGEVAEVLGEYSEESEAKAAAKETNASEDQM